MNPIIFKAILKDTGHAIKIDSEMQGEVIFQIPQVELTNALPLAGMGKKILKIAIIETEGNNEKPEEDNLIQWLKKK